MICFLDKIPSVLLLLIGLGFIYKGIWGSNNETQIAKVFWHDTRYFHGVMYLLASVSKISIARIILFLDILFSVIWRTI